MWVSGKMKIQSRQKKSVQKYILKLIIKVKGKRINSKYN